MNSGAASPRGRGEESPGWPSVSCGPELLAGSPDGAHIAPSGRTETVTRRPRLRTLQRKSTRPDVGVCDSARLVPGPSPPIATESRQTLARAPAPSPSLDRCNVILIAKL
ncbi:hypothetical protein H920_03326 [Fukomys damarensis]|uniref:Uncharacterized protein n=1 Tax=Fukomys damarensis TaxID=885580 RepID=A0A091EIC0_FUKDA|nr:hypothetical protein H920_03326 [Fukomys damarensis]